MSTQSKSISLDIKTPRWALPLLSSARYKGAKGGRASGKSHFFAEMLVEEHVMFPDQQTVCIREIQKSLKFSAKKLIESKIRKLGVSHLFSITLNEIKRIGGNGLIIFQGMQDHTADSIKSLEGFDRAWVEEAQSLSARSIELLIPTIRAPGSELWFSWNPDQPEDAIEQFFTDNSDAVLVHVNYTDNPFCPDEMIKLAEWQRTRDHERYAHIWRGQFNSKSESQIFSGRWRIEEFEPGTLWHGPYCGLDFGFANDPTAAVMCWIHNDDLYIEHEAGGIGIELDATAHTIKTKIPGFERHAIRADSARPESISYLKRHGLPRIVACKKGAGSVIDGIEHIKSYNSIIIHPRCTEMIDEARLYSYRIDKKSGDILPEPEDDANHYWDAVRYALEPIMKRRVTDYSRLK